MRHDIHIRVGHLISGPKNGDSRYRFPWLEHVHILRVVRETQKHDTDSLIDLTRKLFDNIGRCYLLGIGLYTLSESDVVGLFGAGTSSSGPISP
jgi:hypothetical protein